MMTLPYEPAQSAALFYFSSDDTLVAEAATTFTPRLKKWKVRQKCRFNFEGQNVYGIIVEVTTGKYMQLFRIVRQLRARFLFSDNVCICH